MTDVTDMTSEIKEEKGSLKVREVAELRTEVQYPSGTQERRTGCDQEHGTRLVRRDVAQVANRSTVPSWYTGVLYK